MNIKDIANFIFDDVIIFGHCFSELTWDMYVISHDILFGVITMKGDETIETTNAWY